MIINCPNCNKELGVISDESEEARIAYLVSTKCDNCEFQTEAPESSVDQDVDELVKPLQTSLRDIFRKFSAACSKKDIIGKRKTREVYEFMASIELWINRPAPLEVLEEIEKAMDRLGADPDLANSLNPFVTPEILKEMLIDIKGIIE